MSIIETRFDQMFPTFDAGQIETAKRFASSPPRHFEPGETVFDIGERNAPAWLVLKGTIDVVRSNALGGELPITTHHAGQFSGEVSQLAGREALARGRAGAEGCCALPFDASHGRSLMIGSAEIGGTLVPAHILRRVRLIQGGNARSGVARAPGDSDLHPAQ